MPESLHSVRPSITRNELAWLATLDDVESRLIFVDRGEGRTVYRVETGPFDPAYLQALPKRDWTLLVHDVEKHLPTMRGLFRAIPFIPDWRIDDLMVSFAAPGGGVGPHRDNYDVFLCQGIGTRNWRFSDETVPEAPEASTDLALLKEFDSGETHDATAGDILYLPPGVAHWGMAKRACITYSIGMRAPQISDLLLELGRKTPSVDTFYVDPDLLSGEAIPGFISAASTQRALRLLGLSTSHHDEVAVAIGRFSTQPKDWLRPDCATDDEIAGAIERLQNGGSLTVHGMSRIAYDEHSLFVNGRHTGLPDEALILIKQASEKRKVRFRGRSELGIIELLVWMLKRGAFVISGDL